MTCIYAANVTNFSTGGKTLPGFIHVLSTAACSYALLVLEWQYTELTDGQVTANMLPKCFAIKVPSRIPRHVPVNCLAVDALWPLVL